MYFTYIYIIIFNDVSNLENQQPLSARCTSTGLSQAPRRRINSTNLQRAKCRAGQPGPKPSKGDDAAAAKPQRPRRSGDEQATGQQRGEAAPQRGEAAGR